MLHARGENNEENFLGNAALKLVDQEGGGHRNGKSIEEPTIETRFGEDEDADEDAAKDSGNESAEYSDSEDKKEPNIKEIQNALVGMNVSQAINILKSLSDRFNHFLTLHGHCGWIYG